MKFLALIATILLSTSVFATEVVNGTFKLDPKVFHNDPISGRLELTYNPEDLETVKMITNTAVVGKTEFKSTEEYSLNYQTALDEYFSLVYKLNGVPHSWYFVSLMKLENGVYSGAFFKVNQSVEDILYTLSAMVEHGAQPPASWKVIGSVTVER